MQTHEVIEIAAEQWFRAFTPGSIIDFETPEPPEPRPEQEE
jgi:hypothetical protein